MLSVVTIASARLRVGPLSDSQISLAGLINALMQLWFTEPFTKLLRGTPHAPCTNVAAARTGAPATPNAYEMAPAAKSAQALIVADTDDGHRCGMGLRRVRAGI